MKKALTALALAAVGAAAAAGGYWWGLRSAPHAAPKETNAAAQVAPAGKGRILYYRNPMGLPDISPVPKKDPMGMDYIPVYEGEEPPGPPGTVKVSAERVQLLGVRTEPAVPRELVRTVRAVGTVQANERTLYRVAPRFEGWIEKLHVNTTGQAVARGEPLMEVYSPELASAQEEYLIALRGARALAGAAPELETAMRRLAEAALRRLRNWEIAETELETLQQERAPRRLLTYRSPAAGVVLQKPGVAGMRFTPGEVLFEIADLSSVWVLAEVFEQDLALVRTGQAARFQATAWPERSFAGRVAFVYPTLDPATRTARVRLELANPGLALKPAMYGTVELAAPARAKRIAIPDSAVLDSGTRQSVLVRRGEGLFEPRMVKLGMRADGYVEVLEGLAEGDEVVVRGNFLIDAESNLRAALEGFGGRAAPAAAALHKGTGRVEAVDAAAGTVEIAHAPIPSLGWPAMTMEFRVKDKAMLAGVRKGQSVEIEIAPAAPGEYVIERMRPAPAAHRGH